MWELIRANKRRSAILVFVMLVLLLAMGFAIGSAVWPSIGRRMAFSAASAGRGRVYFDPTGGLIGMGVAFIIWLFQALLAYFEGDHILLAASRARLIEKSDHPQLYNVVEEMSIAASLPKMPKIYVVDDMAMNAFATGRDPDNTAVAVTAGLLANCNRDQLQGVIAHEISHIVHRDVLFMTMVGIMLGSIVMLSELFLRGVFYDGGSMRRYRSDSDRGGGGLQIVLIVLALVLALVAPLIAQVIYFACSRRREYLADAGSAVYTRYPEGLASALELIGGQTQPLAAANRATAPMYIVNPFGGGMSLGLTSTHPPLMERVRILRGMAGNVSFQDYGAAWAKVSGANAGRIPGAVLRQDAPIPIRGGFVDEAAAQRDARDRMRQAGDLMRKVNQFQFLSCACGMRIKLPPDFNRDALPCPRCGAVLQVAQAQPLSAAADTPDPGVAPTPIPTAQPRRTLPWTPPVAAPRNPTLPPLEVARTGSGWMSFKCSCGAVKNLAPSFDAPETHCSACGRIIHIRAAQ